MPQVNTWEEEYNNQRFITKHNKPQKFFLRFLKYLKKEERVDIRGKKILDLGSGTGRNANHLAKLGARVSGIEISKTAIKIAIDRAVESDLSVNYIQGNIGEKYNFPDNYFDLVLDITSSNSINNKERDIYLSEVSRVLKKDAYFFVRALCKEGDKNAKKLLKANPGKEADTYLMPETALVERVFSRKDFVSLYSQFKILKLLKETGYTCFGKQNYKRNFWVAYMKK